MSTYVDPYTETTGYDGDDTVSAASYYVSRDAAPSFSYSDVAPEEETLSYVDNSTIVESGTEWDKNRLIPFCDSVIYFLQRMPTTPRKLYKKRARMLKITVMLCLSRLVRFFAPFRLLVFVS